MIDIRGIHRFATDLIGPVAEYRLADGRAQGEISAHLVHRDFGADDAAAVAVRHVDVDEAFTDLGKYRTRCYCRQFRPTSFFLVLYVVLVGQIGGEQNLVLSTSSSNVVVPVGCGPLCVGSIVQGKTAARRRS